MVALVESRVVGFEFGDQRAAFGGVGGGGNFGGRDGEEFALLELDAFPRRIADDAVEAGFAGREGESVATLVWRGRGRPGSLGVAKDVRKFFFPIEAVGMDGCIVDERVAVDDVLRERGQRLAGRGGANPEGELRDLDRFAREVDAVEVVLEDEMGDTVDQLGRIGGVELVEVTEDLEVAVFQGVVGLEEKRSGAAGRVDDLEVLQDFEAAAPVGFIIGNDAAIGVGGIDARGRRPAGGSARRSARRRCSRRYGW